MNAERARSQPFSITNNLKKILLLLLLLLLLLFVLKINRRILVILCNRHRSSSLHGENVALNNVNYKMLIKTKALWRPNRPAISGLMHIIKY